MVLGLSGFYFLKKLSLILGFFVKFISPVYLFLKSSRVKVIPKLELIISGTQINLYENLKLGIGHAFA